MKWDGYEWWQWLTGKPIADNILRPIGKGIIGDAAEDIPMTWDELLGIDKKNEAVSGSENISTGEKWEYNKNNELINHETPTESQNENPTAEETPQDTREQALEDQARAWAREDKIRQEIENREDTAYQRAVRDMKAAGINPNLIMAEPAASGGGITSATMPNYSLQTTELNNAIEKAINAIKNDTTISEGEKNRTNDILKTLLLAFFLKR